MTPEKPETPEEQWDALERLAGSVDDDDELVGDASDDEVEAVLVAHGYDLATVRANGDALLAELANELDAQTGRVSGDRFVAVAQAPVAEPRHDEGPPRAPHREHPQGFLWLAAGVLGLVASGGGAVVAERVAVEGPLRLVAREEPLPIELLAANDLRRDAEEASHAALWASCLAKLDEARQLDPAGDAEPAVRALRARALTELAPVPPPESPLHDKGAR